MDPEENVNEYETKEEPETASKAQNSKNRNLNRPTSTSSSPMPPVPEEIDNGPFVQFESSVGVHNDELAEKLLNDAFDHPITILIGDENKHILKHGIILEQSPFFRRVLENMKTVDLTEFDSSVVLLLIRYLYTGKLNISKTNVQKLLVTADKFELIDVKRKCIQVIQDSLDNTNSFDIRKFAKSYGIPTLLKSADAFITKDLAGLTSSQLFLDVGYDDILELLNSCPRGTMPSATEFSAILAWVQHDETIRESHLPQLMRNLSLDDLFVTAPELLEVPFGRDGILARNNECLFNYAEALKRRASKPQGTRTDSSSGKRRRVQSEETDNSAGTSDNVTRMDQRWEERKDHPLFNDVILNILFEFMRGKDLKTCRLVCKKWCVSSLQSARSKFRIKLEGNREVMTRTLSDFVEVFRQNRFGIPFVKYNLDPFCTTEGPGEEFLQICGSTAKIVYFWEEPQGGFEDMSALLKAMPNIEEFSTTHVRSKSGNVVKLFPDSSTKPTLKFLKNILVWDMDPDRASEQCPTFIEELLSVAPNISDLNVSDSSIDPDRSTISQVLKAIQRVERASVITNLEFTNAKTEHLESLRSLAEMGLKLKNLSFYKDFEGRGGEKKISASCLPQLAKLFKNSIEGLRAVDEVCSSFIQLPHMPKLETLEFGISRDFDSTCVNLNKLFPALKRLELICWEYYEDNDVDEWEVEEFLPNSEPCPNVKSLALSGFVFKSQLLDHILNVFPKLTKFEVTVKTDGAQILRKIMTQMTQLEHLSVTGEIEGIESIDAFLTGVRVERVQELEHVVSELKKMTVQLRTETIRHYRDRYCQSPSIANLTNLKGLYLSITGGDDDDDDELEDDPRRETRLTDVFVYFGLYSMKHINKLKIWNCGFTKGGCEILTTEMGLESWTFQDGDGDDRDIIPQVK